MLVPSWPGPSGLGESAAIGSRHWAPSSVDVCRSSAPQDLPSALVALCVGSLMRDPRVIAGLPAMHQASFGAWQARHTLVPVRSGRSLAAYWPPIERLLLVAYCCPPTGRLLMAACD